jgi:GDP-4-dehydro-6-deoxy-D-mannose reductase
MKRILVTGASGFVGSHLCEHLSGNDYEIFGTVFGNSPDFLLKEIPQDHLRDINLLSRDAVNALIDEIQPQIVFHLAALSSPKASFSDPGTTLSNNLMGQLFLLDALRHHGKKIEKIVVISSAEVYGNVSEDNIPIDEECPMRPLSPYAVSKIAQDYLALQYYLSHQLPIVRFRPANHTGERQSADFVVPAFAKQIAQIESGIQSPTIKVGNLEAVRDFTDVLDVVKAYELVIKNGKPGEVYNLGSGKGVSIREILDLLLAQAKSKVTVSVDKDKYLPVDIPHVVMDTLKYQKASGWKADIPLETTLERVLHYWRQQITNDREVL